MAIGHVVETKHRSSLTEAVAGSIDKETITLPLARKMIYHAIECNEEEILTALKTLAFIENMIVEGSAALALAGFNKVSRNLRGQTSVILLCGANCDQAVINKIIYGLELSIGPVCN